MIVSHDNEDLEALGTKALLVRAGYEMISATFEPTTDIIMAYGTQIKADAFAKDIDPSDFDFLVIPGGKYVANSVDDDKDIKHMAEVFNDSGKLVAAICAGPRFLGQVGLLDGKHFTAYLGSEKDMPKGIYHKDEKSIRDKNIITARSAGVVYQFVYEIVAYLDDESRAKKLMDEILY